MTTAIITHPDCAIHENGSPGHPESPQRLSAINDHLLSSGANAIVAHYEASPVSKAQLQRAHHQDYVEQVFRMAPHEAGQSIMLDGDTGMNTGSLDAALRAAGAAVQAVDLVLGGEHDSVFCVIRPPGHHAAAAHSAGFCIFNNIAVAAHHALAHYGLECVAIVDFDVHHGDGTENIIKNNPNILFCSSFQHPYYPFSGADSRAENVINLPMPDGTTGKQWRKEVVTYWLPELDAFQPQLILISAGFDSHLEDFMGGFRLVEDDYIWITKELSKIAQKHAQGRIVSCLEGGYDLSSLGRSAAAHVKSLATSTD